MGKHKTKRLVGSSRRGWDDNIKMAFENEWEGVERIQTTQDRSEWREFVNSEINVLWIYWAASPWVHSATQMHCTK